MATGTRCIDHFGKFGFCPSAGSWSDKNKWEMLMIHRGPYDSCPGIQLVTTALLAQIYGALSKVSSIDYLLKSSTKVCRTEQFAQLVKLSTLLASSGPGSALCPTVNHIRLQTSPYSMLQTKKRIEVGGPGLRRKYSNERYSATM